MSAKALQALLSDETAAESRVYAIRIPQRSEYPAITYQQIGGSALESANGGSTTQDVLWQIVAHAETYAEAVELFDQVRVILHGYRGTVGGVVVQHILIQDGSIRDLPNLTGDTEQLDRFAKSGDFRVMYEDTTPNP